MAEAAGRKNTIQGRIEQVLSKQMEFPVTIDGAGRTDAGVHAKEQVANFRLNTEKTTQQLQDVLNEYLPEDIRILKVEEAGERFHSRLNATGKVYEYCLCKKADLMYLAENICGRWTKNWMSCG